MSNLGKMPESLEGLPPAKRLCAELDKLGHNHWFYEDSRRLIESYLLDAFKAGMTEAAEISRDTHLNGDISSDAILIARDQTTSL